MAEAVVEETRTDELEFSVDKSERPTEMNVLELVPPEFAVQLLREAESFPQLPMQVIDKYADIAVRHANLKRIGGGQWFANIPGFQGVWASEESQARTLEVLKEVVVDWTLLKIQHKDNDLPVIEEINLNGL